MVFFFFDDPLSRTWEKCWGTLSTYVLNTNAEAWSELQKELPIPSVEKKNDKKHKKKEKKKHKKKIKCLKLLAKICF